MISRVVLHPEKMTLRMGRGVLVIVPVVGVPGEMVDARVPVGVKAGVGVADKSRTEGEIVKIAEGERTVRVGAITRGVPVRGEVGRTAGRTGMDAHEVRSRLTMIIQTGCCFIKMSISYSLSSRAIL